MGQKKARKSHFFINVENLSVFVPHFALFLVPVDKVVSRFCVVSVGVEEKGVDGVPIEGVEAKKIVATVSDLVLTVGVEDEEGVPEEEVPEEEVPEVGESVIVVVATSSGVVVVIVGVAITVVVGVISLLLVEAADLGFILLVVEDIGLVTWGDEEDVGVHNGVVILQGSDLGPVDTGCSQTKLYCKLHMTMCHSPPVKNLPPSSPSRANI